MERLSIVLDNEFDLAALRTFRAVVREGSFTGASRVLRSPKSTVSKRVADLEALLGVRLIERSTRRLRVTTEGALLAERAERILGDVEDIRRELGESGSAPRGHLRISVPAVVGQLFLGQLTARFRALHPEITIECLFLDRVPDLLEEGFDGVVRFGPLDDSGLGARLLCEQRAVVVARPGLPGIEAVREPRDLVRLPKIGPAPSWGETMELHGPEGAIENIRWDPELRLGNPQAVRDAAEAGAGVALVGLIAARESLAAGRLVQLLPGWVGPPKLLYFVYPSPQSVTARLRAFLDVIAEEMRGWPCARPGEPI